MDSLVDCIRELVLSEDVLRKQLAAEPAPKEESPPNKELRSIYTILIAVPKGCSDMGCKGCNKNGVNRSFHLRCLMCGHIYYGHTGGGYTKVTAVCGCMGVGSMCCGGWASTNGDVFMSCGIDPKTSKCWKCRDGE